MRQASRVRTIAAPEIYRMRLLGASVAATIPVLILFALIERRVVGGLRRARSVVGHISAEGVLVGWCLRLPVTGGAVTLELLLVNIAFIRANTRVR